MEEQLLHFIWHRKLYDAIGLTTTAGESVDVFHTGIPNHDQGPDFLQSRIRIGDQLWAGHVEIHILSSAWFLHLHHHDPHYNNVILHVVWEEDQPVVTKDGFIVPTITLSGRVDLSLLDRYRHLMNNEEWVPCASALKDVPAIIRTSWLDRLMAERLEHKTGHVLQVLDRCRQDWEQTFYVMLARQLGAPTNGDPMEELALRVPLPLLRKHGDRIDQIEAILFGAAGMLPRERNVPYVISLKHEFEFLKKKYNLDALQGLQWKFMRMRPAHFPTIRIAHLAVMIAQQAHFITLLEQHLSAEQWIKLFRVRPANPFWNDHYHFSASSPRGSKQLGQNTAVTILINVIAPVMFLYGKHQGRPDLKERAVRLLEELPAEKNNIVTHWQECGWYVADAGQTQALLHLKKQYCDQRKCLHCAVGLYVIK